MSANHGRFTVLSVTFQWEPSRAQVPTDMLRLSEGETLYFLTLRLLSRGTFSSTTYHPFRLWEKVITRRCKWFGGIGVLLLRVCRPK
jgi:hypothetical protein